MPRTPPGPFPEQTSLLSKQCWIACLREQFRPRHTILDGTGKPKASSDSETDKSEEEKALDKKLAALKKQLKKATKKAMKKGRKREAREAGGGSKNKKPSPARKKRRGRSPGSRQSSSGKDAHKKKAKKAKRKRATSSSTSPVKKKGKKKSDRGPGSSDSKDIAKGLFGELGESAKIEKAKKVKLITGLLEVAQRFVTRTMMMFFAKPSPGTTRPTS